ncbi:MAG: flagellin [Candidatus Kapaibacterium sp.]
MPFASGDNARIRTNIPAQNAYNSLNSANKDISLRQLRLSTGKRINNAADDVAGYITSRALTQRNGSLKAALKTVGDAFNITNVLMDALDNINELMTKIKDSTATAASGAMGTDEKVALAKAASQLVEQVQTVADSTVFGGRQLLNGDFNAQFVIGFDADNDLITLNVDMRENNTELDVESGNFNVNANEIQNFAGITGLDMNAFDAVDDQNLGIFADDAIGTTMTSLADAMQNINKVASYLGGLSNRLNSQEVLLNNQIVNYNAAISRLEDADVAKEQLELIKSQFLQQASLVSLAQSNQNPQTFLQLIRG